MSFLGYRKERNDRRRGRYQRVPLFQTEGDGEKRKKRKDRRKEPEGRIVFGTHEKGGSIAANLLRGSINSLAEYMTIHHVLSVSSQM